MAISSTLQAQLADAWINTNSWIVSSLPQQAKGATLPSYSYSVDTGMCEFLNSPGPQAPLAVTGIGLAEGIWESNGNGTMNLTGMSVATLSGTGAAAASFSASSASFPVNFSELLVNGAFAYTQPCQKHQIGPNPKATTDGNGSMSQQWSGQQMILNCAVAANGAVSLTSVTITGTPAATATNLKLNGAPLTEPITEVTEVTAAITNALGWNNVLADAIANSFVSASFTQTLITNLNANVQKSIAAAT